MSKNRNAQMAKLQNAQMPKDPNAPSGASTAAPYFEDRRLLQLIAFCSLQILDWSFVPEPL